MNEIMAVITGCAGLYVGIGFLFIVCETFRRLGDRKKELNAIDQVKINRIKAVVGWLPAIFNKRIARWLVLEKRIVEAKRLYDKMSMQTDISRKFSCSIDESIRPIFEEYLKAGFCIRDLSHEASGVLRDIELGHIMDMQIKKAEGMGRK